MYCFNSLNKKQKCFVESETKVVLDFNIMTYDSTFLYLLGEIITSYICYQGVKNIYLYVLSLMPTTRSMCTNVHRL